MKNTNESINIHHFDNGLTLLGEQMEGVGSSAVSVLLPTGAVNESTSRLGLASLTCEMLSKGAGQWNSQQLSEQFEDLGVDYGQGAGVEATTFSMACLEENLIKAIPLLKTLILEPRFPAEELQSVKDIALQDIKSVEDEPASQVMIELAKRFYPEPFGRTSMGNAEGINSTTLEDIKNFHKNCYSASGSIIGVSGKFDWDKVCAEVQDCFGKWEGKTDRFSPGDLPTENQNILLEKDTKQLQIALAYPSVSHDHPDFYVAKLAVGALSGGMSGRLFIEVREKRGLVYRVSASHSAVKGRAAVFVYAGTTPENGQETLDVICAELKKLKEGVTDQELHRSKLDLKSRLIMQGESSLNRAPAIASDWWNIGRVRTLDEIKQKIDQVTSADIMKHLEQFPVAPMTLVTLGNKKLEF
jgi:predicted Zn-dependent peptidase